MPPNARLCLTAALTTPIKGRNSGPEPPGNAAVWGETPTTPGESSTGWLSYLQIALGVGGQIGMQLAVHFPTPVIGCASYPRVARTSPVGGNSQAGMRSRGLSAV